MTRTHTGHDTARQHDSIDDARALIGGLALVFAVASVLSGDHATTLLFTALAAYFL